jgi:hypothetical protein
MSRSYSELRRLQTLKERYDYLALRGQVGDRTFGSERYINQAFYASTQWRQLRNHVIYRDDACDLGVLGYEIHERIYLHHMNPMTVKAISNGDSEILDPEFLISVTHQTHNAIHYGDASLLPQELVVRRPGDTKLW